MGKIRTRTLGLEEVEEKQKKEQKNRADEKKLKKTTKTTKEEKEVASEAVEVEKPKKEKKSDLKKTDVKKEVSSALSKKHMAALKKVDPKKNYSLSEAIKHLKVIAHAGFDESVELHINLDEQGLRGEVDLPHSIGKTVRVKIVDDSVIGAIEKGTIDFDVLISHPSYMPKLVKFAKILGPRGLMPNPKTGTVSTNPQETMNKFTKGVIRWKSEAKFPLLHQLIGKVSYKPEMIEENIRTFIKSLGKAHIKKAFIKTTMSPAMKLDIESL